MSLYAILKPSPILRDLPLDEQRAITRDAVDDGEYAKVFHGVREVRGQAGLVVAISEASEAQARRRVDELTLVRTGFVGVEFIRAADLQSGQAAEERPVQPVPQPVPLPQPFLPWPHRPVA